MKEGETMTREFVCACEREEGRKGLFGLLCLSRELVRRERDDEDRQRQATFGSFFLCCSSSL